MNIQQILTFMIVAVAAVFLLRQLVAGVRSLVQNKAGCGGGCSKCAFARPDKVLPEQARSNPGVISLGSIRTLPHKAKK